MLCDYFLSSVTEGVQPNTEESGTGLQEDSHGGCGSACAHTRARSQTHVRHPLRSQNECMHRLIFVIFIHSKYYLLTHGLLFVTIRGIPEIAALCV